MIDLIIPFCKMDNILSLRKVIDWASGFNQIKITVVEYGENSILEPFSLKCNLIFAKTKVLSKSWALNLATKKTNNNIIIYCDPNCIINPQSILDSINELNIYEYIVVANKFKIISELDESQGIMNILSNIDNSSIVGEIHISMIKRESFYKISGWCEYLSGNELMNFQLKKIQSILSYKIEDNVCYLYPYNNIFNKSSLYDTLMKLNNNDMLQYVSNEISKIGIKNKD